MWDRSRAAWEQAPNTVQAHTNSGPVQWGRVDQLVIHYTADKHANPDTAAYLRSMQASYVRSRGYSLGYSVAVDQAGVSWEIRGTEFQPAANRGHNDHTWVILCLVDWQNPAPQLMVDEVRNMVAWARTQAGRQLPVVGHRDLAATRCPGDGLYSQIERGVFEPRTPWPPTPVPSPQPQPITDEDTAMQIVSPPVRVYDSRNTAAFGRGETRTIHVGDYRAAFVNLTVVDPSGGGYLTVWGDGGSPPNTSNVNYSHGVNIANSGWTPVRTDGTIQVYTSSPCHVLVDIQAGVK